MAADRANERNAWRDSSALQGGRVRTGTVTTTTSRLLGDGGRSSGVYRCPGRQLGVLRFALRETVPFSVFRLLSLRTRRSRYRISRARARLAPLSRLRRLGFSLKGVPLPLSLPPDDPCDLNPAWYSRLVTVSSLIIKIHFYLNKLKE